MDTGKYEAHEEIRLLNSRFVGREPFSRDSCRALDVTATGGSY